MDERTQKLRRAKAAMQFLKQAIDALENPGNGPSDPDYDLWSAHNWLGMIQADEVVKDSGEDDVEWMRR
jgi:hypothetical protein